MTVIDSVAQTSTALSPPHARAADAVAAEMGVDSVRGLSAASVLDIRKRVGCNRLAEAPAPSRLLKFLRQFNELVIWVLIAAALISGWLGEWIDAIAIIAIVLINGLLGFMQEERAGQALAALKKLSAPKTRAMRDGEIISLPADELVPGDRIEMEAGDLVPADARLLSTVSFAVDEASLTGESSLVEKDAVIVLEPSASLADRRNMVYLGTTAARGRGSAIVTATGMQTELGRIAGMLQHQEIEPTPLQQRLAELGGTLVYICLAIVAIIFILQISRGTKTHEAFLLAVSLAVAAIPEGLPAVVTIALALGLMRMVKRHALIRKLPSVETLGAVTIICSDKTGTLTRNEMTVREIMAGRRQYEVTGSGYAPAGEFRVRGETIAAPTDDCDLRQLLTIGAWCNTSRLSRTEEPPDWRLSGDPTEGALIVAAMKAGIPAANDAHELLFEIPFDSDRKLMTVLALNADGRSIFYTKGAPEIALKCCQFEWVEGNAVALSESRRAEILAANADYASRALRVLGMAFRDGSGIPRDACVESDMTFAGLVGMVDPPRDEARSAVQMCHAAGIRPVMITGDHPDTAIAIARQLGIAGENDRAITGSMLDSMSETQLTAHFGSAQEAGAAGARVFARVTAEHKLRIVRALKAQGHIVAMTGDGVNDAPAVSAADIGIAMGRGGTDVTREAADMVLTDDNFASIVSAVEEGRGIFDDIRKFVQYLIGCNIGEVLFMFIGAVMGWQSPLRAIQILWINLVTDALPALALGIEAPEPGVMERPPRPAAERVITRQRGMRMLFHGALIASVTVAGFAITIHLTPGADWDRARTVAFCILSYSQLFYSFSCRSDRFTLPQLGMFTNRALIWAILISGLLQTAVFLPGVRKIFHVEAGMTWEWPMILLLALLPVTVIEIGKIIKAKRI